MFNYVSSVYSHAHLSSLPLSPPPKICRRGLIFPGFNFLWQACPATTAHSNDGKIEQFVLMRKIRREDRNWLRSDRAEPDGFQTRCPSAAGTCTRPGRSSHVRNQPRRCSEGKQVRLMTVAISSSRNRLTPPFREKPRSTETRPLA